MQLGIRLHDSQVLPLEQRLEVVKKQGFDCCHVALSKVITENSVENAALTPGYAMYLRKLFAKAELDIAVLGCYLNLATPNEEELEKTMERYKANIRFAAHLGCGVVGTETGAPNTFYTFVPECHSEESLRLFIDRVRPVVRYAEQMGVILAIEPVYTHIVSTPARARRVLDEIASPNLQIIFDPVNLLYKTNVQSANEVFRDAIEQLGKDIAVMHIKDYNVEQGNVVSGAAGTGIMDYTDIISFIKNEKPYIQCTLEETVPENAEAARAYMERLYQN